MPGVPGSTKLHHVAASAAVGGQAAREDPDAGPEATAAPRPFRILIVEDQAVTAMDLEEQLLGLGHYVVDVVDSAPAAVAAAREHRPDLVLMDIRLAGGTDGVEAAAEIRSRLAIPSIFLTAHADLDTRRRADAVLPIAFLAKPFTAGDIRRALDRAAVVLGRA